MLWPPSSGAEMIRSARWGTFTNLPKFIPKLENDAHGKILPGSGLQAFIMGKKVMSRPPVNKIYIYVNFVSLLTLS